MSEQINQIDIEEKISEMNEADRITVKLEEQCQNVIEPKKGTLPKGNYALVSVDIDTTGRRLIDEVSLFNCIIIVNIYY